VLQLQVLVAATNEELGGQQAFPPLFVNPSGQTQVAFKVPEILVILGVNP